MASYRHLYAPALEAAHRSSLDYLDALAQSPVAALKPVEELRRQLAHPLSEEGMDAAEVIRQLVRDTEGGLVRSGGPRFFSWVIGGSVPASLGADWLTSAWDQNAGLHAAGPAEALIEEITGAWLKELFGLPAGASFSFVTGCQMAHLTCLAAARHEVLQRAGWDVEADGLSGAPAVKILCTPGRHGTVVRALRLLGMGTRHVEVLGGDAEGRLEADALREAVLRWKENPKIVVLSAGELNTGVFDPFEDLIPIAQAAGCWVHVDGAFGLWAATSPHYRHLLKGVELADSWATDGHKWLNVPYDSGYAFIARPEAHSAAISYRASYLIRTHDAREQMDWTPEWSRRGRAIPTYAAIRELGRTGIAKMVERTCAMARLLAEELGRIEGVELLWSPVINQGLVRFLHPAPASDSDHDVFTDRVIEAILQSGTAYFGGALWRGRRCMRISVSNWLTDEAAVQETVAAVAKLVGELRRERL